MLILGIETSCDETAASVVKDGAIVLSNAVSSQIELHKPYGGVVPEVAARNHVINIVPIIDQALSDADKKLEDIDVIAVTKGPGLITSLLIGLDTAKGLAYASDKKLIGVNHVEAHAYANQLTFDSKNKPAVMQFPLIFLVVSGGHTSLYLMKNHLDYELIGETRDDAVGESFDKVAKLLNLGYPGGPIVSKRANLGNSKAYNFPRPMLDDGFDFSFSGLKTDVLRLVNKKIYFSDPEINNICASFQAAAIEVLVKKTIKAVEQYNAKMLIVGGGVSANKLLNVKMRKEITTLNKNIIVNFPDPTFTTDNAAMIAGTAYHYAQADKYDSWKDLVVDPNLKINI